ncbi:hypothetical protein T484DRAFT_1764136, partial [Baffinella frigidus]
RGHYTAHVRQSVGGWTKLDDHNATVVPDKQVFMEQQQAYLLLYERLDPPAAPAV